MSQERFTTNEAAEKLGVTPARVRQMIVKGEIESEKFGRDRVISAEALKAAMNRKTKPGPAPKQAAKAVFIKGPRTRVGKNG
jgi:excisionase family DNA binding protein